VIFKGSLSLDLVFVGSGVVGSSVFQVETSSFFSSLRGAFNSFTFKVATHNSFSLCHISFTRFTSTL
jgi:hypothetical protein